MNQWPASVLGENKSSHSAADLPTDQHDPVLERVGSFSFRSWLSTGDIITDDLGRTGMIRWFRTDESRVANKRQDGDYLNGRYIWC